MTTSEATLAPDESGMDSVPGSRGVSGSDPEYFDANYQMLRQLARKIMATQRVDHTLQSTGLVHEAYVRIKCVDGFEEFDDAHKLRIGAKAMRNVLVDYARKKSAVKRSPQGARVELDDALEQLEEQLSHPSYSILELDEALKRLEHDDPLAANVMELRLIIGLTQEATAAALGITTHEVRRQERYAKAVLRRDLGGGSRDD